jgi:ferritin-like metal-binding protein YciE
MAAAVSGDDAGKERLVRQLADVHAIEEQALAQIRKAPAIVGDERLAAIFAEHLTETERHERQVRGRLEAHDADPSILKELAGKAVGLGMVFFAAIQADTPGKLTAHAFSYEHMELAAYELLKLTAEEVGDEETAKMAEEIAAEEQRMADRLDEVFEVAVEASLRDTDGKASDAQLDRYLADTHAIEQQALQLLEAAPRLVKDRELRRIFEEELKETKGHERLIRQRLQARGVEPSKAEDAALRIGDLDPEAFFAMQPDTTAKVTGFAFAFEHLEIGAYELLERVAWRAGDEETELTAERIQAQERMARNKLARSWHLAASPRHA